MPTCGGLQLLITTAHVYKGPQANCNRHGVVLCTIQQSFVNLVGPGLLVSIPWKALADMCNLLLLQYGRWG
jgi:hypothetical protein